MGLSDRIRSIRGQMGQVEFAEKIGSSQSSVSAYEKGQRKPDYEVLVRIAKEFGVPLDWLLLDEEEKESSNIRLGRLPKQALYPGIGERIRKIRGTLTQKEFAGCLGVTQRTIVNYETLDRVPKGEVTKKICRQFGVSEKWLLTGSEEEDNPAQQEVTACSKMGNTFPVLERDKSQPIDFIDSQKNDLGNTFPIFEMQSECLRMSQENSKLLRQNGDLRVEIERLRMDLERRDMRIRDLEREVAELREARKGSSAYGSGVAGSAG